MTMCLSYNYSF